MKKKPSLEKYFELPNPGLRAYFKRTESGNTDDYRPPFFKGLTRESVLSRWQKILDKTALHRELPGLYDYEMEMKAKVGPMSIQLPLSDRLESIESYFTDIKLDSEPIRQDAIDETIKFFSKGGGIRIRSLANTIDAMRKSTNCGNPWFTKRKLVVDKVLKSTISLENGTWKCHTPSGTYDLCAVLGWRGQEGGISNDDVKQRVIWMMSMILNAYELSFYQPAIESIQKNELIPAYISMDKVDQEVTKLFDTKGNDDVVICTDFTKFDQHFNRDMQNAAESVIRRLINKSDSAWVDNYFRAKFEIPLVCSEDIEYVGEHGMGSGSGGTNFDECMAHKCLQFEAALDAHQSLNPHSMAYGDDGILTYPGIKVEDVIRTYTRHGQIMNDSKQYVSKHDCVVLRRWHGVGYRVNGTMVGVYSTFRALGRLLAQERFYDPEKWSAEMVEMRALSILENCKWSPVFHEFIDFVMTGDKYKLGLDLPGFFDNIEKIAQKAMNEFGEDFLGYTKTLQKEDSALTSEVQGGIQTWEVVKYLKSKIHK